MYKDYPEHSEIIKNMPNFSANNQKRVNQPVNDLESLMKDAAAAQK